MIIINKNTTVEELKEIFKNKNNFNKVYKSYYDKFEDNKLLMVSCKPYKLNNDDIKGILKHIGMK